MRLNLGCGRDIRQGWVNIDSVPAPGVDHVIDLGGKTALPFGDSTIEHSEGSHLIEHLSDPLPFMEELWRVTRPGGTATFRCPYGSTDDADEDPTHARRMYTGSWNYFSQPFYWRASYGYHGDWQPAEITLLPFPEYTTCSDTQLQHLIRHQRNIIAEMTATLRCVKPARAPRRELQEPCELVRAYPRPEDTT